MTRMRAWLLAAMTAIGTAAAPATVLADNCSPSNRADCERTAGYNATVSVISGVGIFGGLMLGGALLGGAGDGDDDGDASDDLFDDPDSADGTGEDDTPVTSIR
jgi:hypothetical protein